MMLVSDSLLLLSFRLCWLWLRVCLILECLHTQFHYSFHLVAICSVEIELLPLVCYLVSFDILNFLIGLTLAKGWFGHVRLGQLLIFGWSNYKDVKAILLDLSHDRVQHEITDGLRAWREYTRGVHIVPDAVDLSDCNPMISIVADEPLLISHDDVLVFLAVEWNDFDFAELFQGF